eukprot:gene22652-26895_t
MIRGPAVNILANSSAKQEIFRTYCEEMTDWRTDISYRLNPSNNKYPLW